MLCDFSQLDLISMYLMLSAVLPKINVIGS